MVPIKEIKRRSERVRVGMEKEGIDALLTFHPKNILYLTGKETGGKVLITKDEAILWVKEVYKGIHEDFYSQKGYSFEVKLDEKNTVKKTIEKSKLKEIWVENLRILNFKKLQSELNTKLIPTDLVENVRAIKSNYEISLLRESAKIAKQGMERAYEVVQADIREIDAVAEIEFCIRKLGSETPPFESGALLSSGKNSANIHPLSSKEKIQKDSLVVVDLGARVQNYYSDMTRTIKVGNLDEEGEKIFNFIKNLEMEAIDKLGEGLKASEIHDFVQREINKKLGCSFYHSTGHGIGLNVHELPNLGPDSEDILKEGMVFTIEPGVYLPRKFGVRFEDMVLLKKNKVEILTK